MRHIPLLVILGAITLPAFCAPPDDVDEEIRRLIAALSDEKYESVTAATERLAELGHHGAAAKEKLIEMLDGPYAAHAADALATMGPDAARRVLDAIDKGVVRLGVPRNLPAAGPEIIADVMAMKRFPELARGSDLTGYFFMKFETQYVLDAARHMLGHKRSEVRIAGANLLTNVAVRTDVDIPISFLAHVLKSATNEEEIGNVALLMAYGGEQAEPYAEQIVGAINRITDRAILSQVINTFLRESTDCNAVARVMLTQPQLPFRHPNHDLCIDDLIRIGREAMQSESADARANGLALYLYATRRNLADLSASALLPLLKDDGGISVAVLSRLFLAKNVPMNAEIVSILIDLAKSNDKALRHTSIAMLGKHAIHYPRVEDALRRAFDDEETLVRFGALVHLGSLEDYDESTLNAVLKLAHSPDWSVQWAAAGALRKLGATSPEVLDAMLAIIDSDLDAKNTGRQQGPREAITAIAELVASGYAPPEILVAIIQEPLPEVTSHDNFIQFAIHSEAIRSLDRIGPAAIPILLDLLGDEESRLDAFVALNSIGGLDNGDLAIADAQLGGRFHSIQASYVNHTLSQAIEDVCDDAVPYLLEAVRADDPNVRSNAARILGNIGSRIDVVTPELWSLLSDQDDQVASSAFDALRMIDSNCVMPIERVILRLRKGNSGERKYAIKQLLESNNPQVIPNLLELARSDDRDLSHRAMAALAQLDPTNGELIQLCIEALDRPNDHAVALAAIHEIGPAAVKAAPKLVPLLQYQSPSYRPPRVRDILVKFGPPAIPHLVAGLDAPEWQVRAGAAEALGEIRPADKNVLHHLEALAKDPNYIVAKSARDAMRRIRVEFNRK